MNPWLVLLPLAVVNVAVALASYGRGRDAAWFPWVTVFACAASGLLWVWAVRRMPTPGGLYALGLAWDALLVAVWVVVPAALCGVRLTPVAVVWLAVLLTAVVGLKGSLS